MCGIAGFVNWGDASVLAAMTDVQRHRGPDDQGRETFELADGDRIGLGSRRLAIVDLSAAGHMPMPSPNRKLWIVYNGEVYNFPELRTELEAKGERFRSHTDTEVVLRLYEREGPQCVQRLNGMFALAILDVREARPTLFLARDHFGVKPLYYVQRGRRFGFASEIKALLELPGLEAQLDAAALQQYLTFLWVPDPNTAFEGVYKLPAGHYAIWRDGELRVQQYWDLTFPPAGHRFQQHPEAELAARVRELLAASVRRQMISDVPLGAFLSAGLDSSSIVALMAQATAEPVRTYTISFPAKLRVGESRLDDPAVAKRTAEHFGCQHEEICVDPAAAELLPKLVWHMDEPTADPAIITAYLVCREARKTVTVLLSGIGGDEVFAGYRKYSAARWAAAYRQIPGFFRRHVLERIVSGLPTLQGSALKSVSRLAKKMVRSASLEPVDAFLTNCTYLDEQHRAELCLDNAPLPDAWRMHRAHFRRVAHAEFLNQMLYVDTKAFMPTLNLTYNDKMSMASSVEARVPFLDRELAEFAAWEVPPELKLKGWWRPRTKYLLRRAMAGVLPAEVLRQPKAGFFAPIDYWLMHDLREMTDDLLGETRVRQRGLFRPAAVAKMVREHRTGRADWSMQIWQLLTLELWSQAFLDGRRARRDVALGA